MVMVDKLRLIQECTYEYIYIYSVCFMLQIVNVLDRFVYGQVNHVEKRRD